MKRGPNIGYSALIDSDELYRRLEVEKDLVARFFIVFSRLEYALKRTDTYARENAGRAEANWRKFAVDHARDFNFEKTETLKRAVDYLEDRPPLKQVLRGSTLGWDNVPVETPRLWDLLRSVCRVRNNLFHGGKFPSGRVPEPGRDKKLLESCIVILGECLDLDESLRTYFHTNEPG